MFVHSLFVAVQKGSGLEHLAGSWPLGAPANSLHAIHHLITADNVTVNYGGGVDPHAQ